MARNLAQADENETQSEERQYAAHPSRAGFPLPHTSVSDGCIEVDPAD